jgi:hypothetical protein
MSLEKKRKDHIVGGMNDALGFTILCGGVGARHAKLGAMGEEESAGAGVVKLTTVVALNSLDGGAELSTCIGEKIRQCRKGVRFQLKGKRP